MERSSSVIHSLQNSITLSQCCQCKDNIISLTKQEPDPACQLDKISSTTASAERFLLDIDLPAISISLKSCQLEEPYFAKKGLFDKCLQTRHDFGTNTENAWSLTEAEPVYVYRPPSNPCRAQIYSIPINPLGSLMRKPFRLKKSVGAKLGKWSLFHCDGTPITGDHSMANNGAQVIMKNRVPPGGFSSGLW